MWEKSQEKWINSIGYMEMCIWAWVCVNTMCEHLYMDMCEYVNIVCEH